jgi:hypothetical protein
MTAEHFTSVEFSTGIPLVNYRLDPETISEIFSSHAGLVSQYTN